MGTTYSFFAKFVCRPPKGIAVVILNHTAQPQKMQGAGRFWAVFAQKMHLSPRIFHKDGRKILVKPRAAAVI
ncbi:hypothetical protein [Gemmiger formicilis]|uniref:hypothetical protein n=1 Tax=Gemmiger formicilis TaxID=745368 RepID=UPI00195D9837|nr:hypothetical protein [Gemmiger formicilis]